MRLFPRNIHFATKAGWLVLLLESGVHVQGFCDALEVCVALAVVRVNAAVLTNVPPCV